MMIFTRMKHMLKFVRKPYNGDGIRVLHGIFYRYIQMYMLVFSLSTQQHTKGFHVIILHYSRQNDYHYLEERVVCLTSNL